MCRSCSQLWSPPVCVYVLHPEDIFYSPWPWPRSCGPCPGLVLLRSSHHIRALQTEASQYNLGFFLNLQHRFHVKLIALKVVVSVSHILWQIVHKFAEHLHRLSGLRCMSLTVTLACVLDSITGCSGVRLFSQKVYPEGTTFTVVNVYITPLVTNIPSSYCKPSECPNRRLLLNTRVRDAVKLFWRINWNMRRQWDNLSRWIRKRETLWYNNAMWRFLSTLFLSYPFVVSACRQVCV